jgi:hypothetical protein
MLECAEFVQNAAERPNIGLGIVVAALADFGRKIIRSADLGAAYLEGVLENFCDTEIAQFDCAVFHHKDVLAFQIAMENLAIVDVFDGKRDLDEIVENFFLGKWFSPGLFDFG